MQLHHVVYRQEIRRWAVNGLGYHDDAREIRLIADRRNLVPVGPRCHAAHHSRQRPLALRVLPDSAFEFAVELLGAGAAYEYLRRHYRGADRRLDALLAASDAASSVASEPNGGL